MKKRFITIIFGVGVGVFLGTMIVYAQVPTPSILRGFVNLNDWVSNLINLLVLVAMVVAIFFLIFAGYQYITAGGNAEQAAAARSGILNAIIGIVIVLVAWALVTWLMSRLIGQNQIQI